MGWGSSAYVSISINEENLRLRFEKDEQFRQTYLASIDFLRDHYVQIPERLKNPVYFEVLSYYLSFSDQPLEYEISTFITEVKGLELESPIDVLELLVLTAYLSCKLPEETISIHCGDASCFVLKLNLKKGKVTDISREYWDFNKNKQVRIRKEIPDYEDAFRCSETEMLEFFKVPITRKLKKHVEEDYLSAFDETCEHIKINRKNIRTILPEIKKFKKLKILEMRGNRISSLPKELLELPCLEELDLSSNKFTTIPPEIKELKQLKRLNISFMRLKQLPDELMELPNLTALNISQNELNGLPEHIGKLKKLEKLNASDNKIPLLPDSFCELTSLREFVMIRAELEKLPEQFGNLTALEGLRVERNKITSLPESFSQLRKIRELDLGMSGNEGFSEFPKVLLALEELEKLSFGFLCSYTHLPEDIHRMKSLRKLDLHCSKKLESLPDSICELSNLEELNVESTLLRSLPEQIGKLQKLKSLDIGQTHILKLPESILELTGLEMQTDKGILKMKGPETKAYFEKIIESREELKEVIANMGNVFKFCSEKLRSDPEFIRWFDEKSHSSTSYDGNALYYMSDTLKNDKAFAREFITERSVYKLRFFSEAVRSDFEIIKTAFSKSMDIFEYLPEKLKQDEDFLGQLFQMNSRVYSKFPESMRRKSEYLFEAIKDGPYNVCHVPEEFRMNKDIMVYALKSYWFNDSYDFIPLELKQDRWFVVRAIIQFDLDKLESEIKTMYEKDELINQLLPLPLKEKIKKVREYFKEHSPDVNIDEVIVHEQ